MTVSTEVDHNDYTGNGVTTSFPYTFRIFQKSDLMVQVADLNENITVLTLDTDYTVTGAGGYSGGAVVLTSPLANGWQISISRDLPVTQETDLRNQGKFFAEVHEDAFDKLTMLIQQCVGFLRLALRKPSFIANYYDALNNRIRNLRDPSQAQDAATKKYVDTSVAGSTSHADDLFKRTIRVPENYVDMVSSVDARKNSLFGWDTSGNPVPIFSMTDTADLAIKLASTTPGLGDSLVAHVDGGKVRDYIYYVTPQSQGCPCNGVDDDTSKFNAMVQKFRNIYVPQGNYILDINTITIPSNTTITFHQNAIVTLKTQSVPGGSGINYWLFKVAGTSSNLIERVRISGGVFIGANDSITFLAVGSYVDDLIAQDVKCKNIRGVMARDGDGTYDNSTTASRPKHLKFINVIGNLSVTPVTTNAHIQLNYVEQVVVERCDSYGYWFGCMGWGGDSAISANGGATNYRKCRSVRFENCFCFVKEAGIWVSMGYDIDIISNFAETITPTSSDVGFDLEGSQQCNVRSNTARNFLNGNLATFFYCRQVTFTNNKSWITNASCRHMRFNNASQDTGAREIRVSQNMFYSEGNVSAITQNGAAHNLVVEKNTLMNTVVSLIANNNGVIKIIGNESHFSLAPTQTFNGYGYYTAFAIGAHHGFSGGPCGAYFEGNTVTSDVAWDASMSCAFLVVHTSDVRSTWANISGGGVLSSGWKYDFGLLNSNSSNSFGARYAVSDFRVYSESFLTGQNTSSRYPEGLVNARNQFGQRWPTSPVAGAYMAAGQEFPLLAPTATKRGTYVYVAGVGSAAVTADYQ